MKLYTMTIFLGSTMMTHQSNTMHGIICALRDLSIKVPEYGDYLTGEVMDEFIDDLVSLKHGDPALHISQSTPYIRIDCEELSCPPTLPDCSTEKEVSPWQK